MNLQLMTQNDFKYLEKLYKSPKVMKQITGYPLEQYECQERLEKILSWDNQKGYGYFMAFDQQQCIGMGCLCPFQKDVEVGYMIYPEYWGQGYGSKLCQLLVEKALKMDVKRIVAYIDPNNKASLKILIKNGFHSVYTKGDEQFLERKVRLDITGYTGLYGIIANPIKHSFSPKMHNTAFQTLGIDDVYLAFEVEEKKLSHFITSVKTLNIKGFNVSMPYKIKIMDYLDEITPEAQLCQAVNTVKYENDKLIGHISDGKGFFMACEEKGWFIHNQKIVVLGAGGAASAIIVEAALQGAREIIVYNRSDKPFIRKLNEQLECPIILKTLSHLDELKEDLKDTYLLIQTTNVCMAPYKDDCLIPDSSYLLKNLKIADIIYNPKETKLLKMAKEKGLEYMNGEGMILYQGAVSFEFWTGQKMPINEVKKALGME